jgi:hypothetical protein
VTEIQVWSLGAVLALAAVHLLAGYLRFLSGTPRSIWLSIFGGISVAYVFVHLLPELAEGQDVLSRAFGGHWRTLEQHVYLIALLGLALFYGVERTTLDAQTRESERGEKTEGSTAGSRAFWLSMGSFAIYNGLIGYLLLHRFGVVVAEGGATAERVSADHRGLLLFALAMVLHFVVNDYGLRERHRGAYEHLGRWILAAAVVVGWIIGLIREVPEALLAALTAFLAGGVILNVLKEELPEERRSRFWRFAVGAAAYAALLIVL